MNKNIPTYQLNILSKHDGDTLDVFLLNKRLEVPTKRIDIPYRSNYYKIGLCLRGRAELKANLETYTVESNYLVTMSPHIIKQWTFMSDDFDSLNIFFTKDFITSNNNLNLDRFPFFESVARHAFQISAAQSENIVASFNFLQQKYDAPHAYRNEILKNLINSLLYEIASIYDRQPALSNSVRTRSQLLASDFKKLVNVHCSTERSVTFYSEKLFLTSKHLTETVKEVTGKTASGWIEETVILEAKVLLQNPSLTISQISDTLHFADQSTFGKFFKKSTGLSPVAYRQAS
ncbi:MAG: AraC family transcriptional regulator [Rhizobacter sp.]|nr:AraC family transcriptional regulator [Chlorobiales bacterium]